MKVCLHETLVALLEAIGLFDSARSPPIRLLREMPSPCFLGHPIEETVHG